MVFKKNLFIILFFTLNLTFAAKDSGLALDTLVKEREISLSHAKLFSKVLTQDSEGRIKPFHTLSSEILRKVSRKSSIYSQNPVQVVLGMSIDPLLWQMLPIIKVSHSDVLNLIKQDGTHVSFVSFFNQNNTYILTPYVEAAYAKKPIERTDFDKQIMEVDERVNICSMVFSNELINIFPSKESTDISWSKDVAMDIPGVDSLKTSSFHAIYRSLVFESFLKNNWEPSDAMVNFVIDYQNQHAQSILPSQLKINLELLYNNLDPFGWTRLFSLYLFTGLFFLIILLIQIFYPNNIFSRLISIFYFLMFSGFVFHLFALALRWYISGHAPWSDAYESVIFIAFATMLAGMVFAKKSHFSLVASSLVASMLLFVANLNWLNPEITNLVPVLKSYWLMIHVSVITSSYGFFGLCAFLGFLSILLIVISNNSIVQKNVKDFTVINEQSMIIGLFLMTIGTFLGGVWANESWGRYWGWDPKETWALVSCILYSLILHIRLLKSKRYIYFFNVCALFGFSSILMTYFGVNYYLDGLHSYAAGDAFPVPSFVLPTLIIFIAISFVGFFRFNKWYN